ncbi:MAG: TonB-dependent receptor [Bacteroidales bacterium]|nr:TonB-dependent receptor [Bacteroidales bacterium]
MKGKYIIIIFLYTFFWLNIYSQKNIYEISGIVQDASNGNALIGANILILGQPIGIITNEDGIFILRLKQGEYVMVVSYIGYKTDTSQIDLNENINLKFQLEPKPVEGEEIYFVGNKDKNIESIDIGVIDFNKEEFTNIPSLFGEADPIKILQLTPGIQSAKEGFTGIYIRGGGPDQNLILLDEAIVYNPSHLYGFFSIFNPDIVESVQLTKSGMPAEYGGRLASVLNIQTREGDYKQHHLNGGIGLLSSKLSIEGPIIKNKMSYIISGRRTNIDLILKSFGSKLLEFDNLISNYYFGDLNGKLAFKLSEKDNIFFTGYMGKDEYKLDKEDFSFTTNINWDNYLGSVVWNHIFNENTYLKNTISYTQYNFIFSGQHTKYGFQLNSNIKNLHYKNILNILRNNHLLKFGTELNKYNIKPTEQNAQLNKVKINFIDEGYFLSYELAAFIGDDFELNRFRFNIGLRYSHFIQTGPLKRYEKDYTGEITDSINFPAGAIISSYNRLEPRFSTRYLINSQSSVKLSYTYNNQYIHIAPVSSVSLPTDIWVPSTDRIKPQVGNQFTLGYYRNLMNNTYEFSTEAYYKYFNNLIEFKSGLVEIQSNTIEDKLFFGEGESYGIEFFAKKIKGNFSGWIGYTLSKTTRQFEELNNGKPFLAKYDRRHDFSLVNNYLLNDKWNFSLVFIYATGNVLTLPVSRYLIQGLIINKYAGINTFRMPAYHRMDISATYNIHKPNYSMIWNFSVYNLYNNKNPYYIYFEVIGSPEEKRLEVKPKVVTLFPVLPSITWSIKF